MTRTSTPHDPVGASPPPPGATGRGTATGGLGTAANLEDTQQYNLHDLAVLPDPELAALLEPETLAPERFAPEPVPAIWRKPTSRHRERRGSRPGSRALIPILILVAGGALALTLRDVGALSGGLGANGPLVEADAWFPSLPAGSLPSIAPPTAEPAPTEDAGKGNGKGNGNGRGRGNGNDHDDG